MNWGKHMGGAVARVIGVALGVALLCWLLVEASPGTTQERAARAAGVLPADDSAIPAPHRAKLIATVAQELELDGGMAARVTRRIGGLFVLDFGRSWSDGGSVSARLSAAAPATLLLVLLGLLVGIAAGLAIAIGSAQRVGGAFDTAMAIASAVAISLPVVWIAILLTRTFAAGHPWQWFPVEGLSLSGGVLPVFAMSLVPAFVLGRHGRAALIEAAAQPWAMAARARGVSARRLVAVHALRASGAALLPLAVVFVAYLLGAAVVVERVFGIRGLGALLLDASAHGDAPVIVGVSVIAALMIAAASAAVDAIRVVVDPREAR